MDKKDAAPRVVIRLLSAAAALVVGGLLLPSAWAAPTLEGTPTAEASAQELSEAERILQEVAALTESFQDYATQPGWTLLEFEQIELLSYNSPKPLPPRYRGEYWEHFNEKRQVFEAVRYVIAPELGRVLTGYDRNGESVSVWHGERYPQPPYTPDFLLGLAHILGATADSGGEPFFEVSAREATLEGRAVWVVEARSEYPDDVKTWPNAVGKPLWGIHTWYYVDRETGMILRCESSYVLKDGTLVPAGGVWTRRILANVEPPDVVLEVLRRASMGEDER